MEHVILIIGPVSQAASLPVMLEKHGYPFLLAKGPLKMRAILESHAISLILWVEETGNRALNIDFRSEWEKHPDIPVIHLFADGSSSVETDHSNQLVDTIPLKALDAAMISRLQMLHASRSNFAASPKGMKTELAFRNVVASLWEHRKKSGDSHLSSPFGKGEEIRNTETALGARERELLNTAEGPPGGKQENSVIKTLQWLKRKILP